MKLKLNKNCKDQKLGYETIEIVHVYPWAIQEKTDIFGDWCKNPVICNTLCKVTDTPKGAKKVAIITMVAIECAIDDGEYILA